MSAEAAQIKDGSCPNCGGKLELAGKDCTLSLLRYRDLSLTGCRTACGPRARGPAGASGDAAGGLGI